MKYDLDIIEYVFFPPVYFHLRFLVTSKSCISGFRHVGEIINIKHLSEKNNVNFPNKYDNSNNVNFMI